MAAGLFREKVKDGLRGLGLRGPDRVAPISTYDPWVSSAPGPNTSGPAKGAFERMFWENKGRAIDKWLHYLPIYERHFAPFRNRPVRVLEIGVQNGGSAAMWREWFGSEAVIFGIDIDPACAGANGEAAQIRIGSQDDPAFLRAVVAEMGGLDIVIDDGSHQMDHIHASFEVLFPILSEGGLYLVEDLHTAYWSSFGGGHGTKGSFIETAKRLIDDMHHWYHVNGQADGPAKGHLGAVHFYDSIIVIDKAEMKPPRRAVTGTETVTSPRKEGQT